MVIPLVVLALVLQNADPLLSRLEGRWEGSGTVLGQAASLTMQWQWTLDGRFLELTFRNDMAGPSGSRRFEARAYYRPSGDGRYRGIWVDNSGAIRPIEARAEGEALVATWGTPETEVGETTYRFMDDGGLEVADRVRQRDGTWRPFGQSRLKRQ